MELIRNLKEGNTFPLEGEVYFPLFDRFINLAVEDAADASYIQACAEYLANLSPPVVEALCLACIRYCNGFLELVGEEVKAFASPRDVLALVSPSGLIIPNPNAANEPVIHMELNCAWEAEHGMEWVIRGDRVLYVGSFNYEDPWREFRPNEAFNYA